MKRKIIGVIPLYDEMRDSYWMVPGYMKMVEQEGAVPLMLPLTEDQNELDFFLELCGGFIFTGGQDVAPEFYHTKRIAACGASCQKPDEMEAYLLKCAVQEDKAVLGICRGIQLMNVCFGGTLYQDLPSEYDSGINHHMEPPYNRPVHLVDIRKDTILYDVTGSERIGVNSYHHQAVRKLSRRFTELAVSEDGLTEAAAMSDKRFVVGVQWHPEFSYETDENSRKLIRAFVSRV